MKVKVEWEDFESREKGWTGKMWGGTGGGASSLRPSPEWVFANESQVRRSIDSFLSLLLPGLRL